MIFALLILERDIQRRSTCLVAVLAMKISITLPIQHGINVKYLLLKGNYFLHQADRKEELTKDPLFVKGFSPTAMHVIANLSFIL